MPLAMAISKLFPALVSLEHTKKTRTMINKTNYKTEIGFEFVKIRGLVVYPRWNYKYKNFYLG